VSSSLQRLAPRPAASSRLFCFPHAGGSAASFRLWPRLLPEIDICAVQLPGRANRMAEPFATSIATMVDDLLPDLLPLLDCPFALFGHSMGTALVVELALRLQDMGTSQPCHLFMSGRQPPHRPFPEESMHGLSDPDFLAWLNHRFGDFPPEVSACPELLELLMPLFRGDFEALESHRPTSTPPIPCPITALGGDADKITTEDHLRAWQACTTQPLRVHLFPGGHFYLDDSAQSVTALVRDHMALAAALAPTSRKIVE
jgi:medium-chain acyl-[acyl-carrier-protein] hydrolase